VRKGEGEFFEFIVHIAPPNPSGDNPSVDRSEFAELYGRRWVRGMLDLGRFQTGRFYREIRAPEWSHTWNDDEFPDQDLEPELLTALQRLEAAEELTGEPLEIDFEGIALILNLDIARVQRVLRSLTEQGLAERVERGDASTHRITELGRTRLESFTRRR
jgi:DNA-binding MarR family transcriptional regulator